MYEFAAKRPILFEIILVVVAFILAFACAFIPSVLYFPNELCTAIGRALAGILLLVVFHKLFDLRKSFSGFLIALPALLFAVWNVLNHFVTNGPEGTQYAIILGIAPAIFEEVLFRGIFIGNLKASGKPDLNATVISAIVFSLIHLTNIVGQPAIQVILQVVYSLVIGLVFGAIYVKSGDIVTVMVLHAAIDITNYLFPGGSTTPWAMVILFVVLLAAEAGYALWLVKKDPEIAA